MEYKNPKPTVDVVVVMEHDRYDPNYDYILLVKRKNPPYGWALPGGFVNEGESFEQAALREAKEEVGLDLELVEQFYTYSDPARDPRQHNTSTVYLAQRVDEEQEPVAGDDATEFAVVTMDAALGMKLAFDHKKILQDVLEFHLNGVRPKP